MAIEQGLYKYLKVIPIGGTAISVPVSSSGMKFNSETKDIRAVGSRKPYVLYSGEIKYSGSFDAILIPSIIDVLKLAYQEDTNGYLKEFDVDDGEVALKNCKLSSLKISIPLGKPITCSFDFVAKSKDTGTSVSAPTISVAFVPSNITLSGIADYDCESIDISISNSLKEIYGLKGTDAKKPKFIAEGEQKIEVEVKYIENPGLDIDNISVIDEGSISIKGTDDTTTFSISLTKLIASNIDKNTKKDDIIRFGVSYIAKDISFSIS